MTGVVMRPNFVLSTIVSLALICVATPVGAAQGRGVSRGGRVARGTVRAAPRAVVRVAPRVVRSQVIRPRVIAVSPYRFSRPYYAFRPRVSLGFGLWVGYPVLYPYYYRYPYPYAYSYPYSYPYPPPAYGYPAPPYAYPAPNPSTTYPPSGYPQVGPVTVQPGTTSGAGVSFEITPVDADVYVDGTYVGRVASFGPLSQPLPVAPGRHLIEIRREGYQTLSFDADVTAGQVIPYQGAMQPLGR
jgi:PEGA domain-containing protein